MEQPTSQEADSEATSQGEVPGTREEQVIEDVKDHTPESRIFPNVHQKDSCINCTDVDNNIWSCN